MSIDLVWIGADNDGPPIWVLGETLSVPDSLDALAKGVDHHLHAGAADALLFWAAGRPLPDPDLLSRLLDQPDDAWHAGLALGMAGLPGAIDAVVPTWMLNRDPDPTIEATSWRLSLDACLVRTRVIQGLGFVDPTFASAAAAGLDLGHRWITGGARLRSCPALVAAGPPARAPRISTDDGLRFVTRRFGRRWSRWAALRLVATRQLGPAAAIQSLRAIGHDTAPTHPAGPLERQATPTTEATNPTVTVLIPTIERYPYLRVVLDQLRSQTRPPDQVVVIDQTPAADRDLALDADFADLPLTLLRLDASGQSSARNAGLEQSTGDLILFIDDDDEVEPDLIARHLANLADPSLDVSSGTAVEPGSGDLPPEFLRFRVSDTFPTNNTMARRAALDRSGWFDLAYDRGDRADHDLGMRLYLTGCRMILDPDITVLHHHAPRGGLRVHNARATTYGGSRQTILTRRPLSATQIYLWTRYYRPDQVHEAKVLFLSSMLNGSGPRWQRLLRAGAQAVLLLDTNGSVRASSAVAADLGTEFPQIPHWSAA